MCSALRCIALHCIASHMDKPVGRMSRRRIISSSRRHILSLQHLFTMTGHPDEIKHCEPKLYLDALFLRCDIHVISDNAKELKSHVIILSVRCLY